MNFKKSALSCLAISIILSSLVVSVNAASTSSYIGGDKGYATLTSSSSEASTTTSNYIGNYYTYAKATVDYTDGDWDSAWGDGLGSASKSVSKKAGATINLWSSTNVVRTAVAYNEGTAYSGGCSLTSY